MDQIDRNSKLPLYHQLYEITRDKIRRGDLKPGDLVPPESELMAQYRVSRAVARQALEMLVNEGFIYRQRGRGSFVAHHTVEEDLVRLINFTRDMRNRGFAPSTKVLLSQLVPAPVDIADKLQVSPGEELALLERLRLADGEPMSVEESYLIHRYCPDVLQDDYTVESLREALERKYGIRWLRARQVIRAVPASRDMARLLSIPPRAALLYIERVSYSQQNIPLEFLRIYYRGDRYTLYSELQG